MHVINIGNARMAMLKLANHTLDPLPNVYVRGWVKSSPNLPMFALEWIQNLYFIFRYTACINFYSAVLLLHVVFLVLLCSCFLALVVSLPFVELVVGHCSVGLIDGRGKGKLGEC